MHPGGSAAGLGGLAQREQLTPARRGDGVQALLRPAQLVQAVAGAAQPVEPVRRPADGVDPLRGARVGADGTAWRLPVPKMHTSFLYLLS